MFQDLVKQAAHIMAGRAHSVYCGLRYRHHRLSVVLPPIPSENLGDQAMVLGAIDELRRRGKPHSQLITTGPRFDFDAAAISPFLLADRHHYFCSDRCFYEELYLAQDLSQCYQLLVFGADVLDGHYGKSRYQRTFAAIRKAVEFGVYVRIIGFSISETPCPDAIKFFRDYSDQVELYPRDPVSMRRLSDAGAVNLTLAADVAFLMQAAPKTSLPGASNAFIESFPGNTIGVSLHSNFFGDDPERIIRYISDVLGELAKFEEYGFLFVPHHPADLEYFQRVKEGLPVDLLSRCHFVSELPTAPVAKRMFACCRHVLSSRMHVAIAALSTQTPVTCFPYFGKFEGLFEHFHLSDGLIYADQFPQKANALAERIQAQIVDGPAIRNRIGSRLPAIVKLSQGNFCDPPSLVGSNSQNI